VLEAHRHLERLLGAVDHLDVAGGCLEAVGHTGRSRRPLGRSGPRVAFVRVRVVYLIQSDQATASYSIPERSASFLLHWSDEVVAGSNALHRPRTSWAEGRNELYRIASRIGFDYYVFLDDDLEMSFELDAFESLLDAHAPRRAVPWLNHHWNTVVLGEVDRVKYVDHCFVAVRADCAERLLPYTTEFDESNWWLTAEEMCERFWAQWPLGTLRFNDLEVKNLQHRNYPKANYLGLPENTAVALGSGAQA